MNWTRLKFLCKMRVSWFVCVRVYAVHRVPLPKPKRMINLRQIAPWNWVPYAEKHIVQINRTYQWLTLMLVSNYRAQCWMRFVQLAHANRDPAGVWANSFEGARMSDPGPGIEHFMLRAPRSQLTRVHNEKYTRLANANRVLPYLHWIRGV